MNKLKNYRIKEVIKETGESEFYIQQKTLFFFWTLWLCGIIYFETKEDAEAKIMAMCDKNVKYHNVNCK